MKKIMKNAVSLNQNTVKSNKKEPLLKFLTDFLPLILFFTIYKTSDHPQPIIMATIYLVVSTIIALIISYIFTKKIAKMPLFSAILLGIFGGLTIFSGNELFIKIKPTLLNSIFFIILFISCLIKKPVLSYLFDGAIKMNQESWIKFSYRWSYFFLFLAFLNELIWRNFSTDFWIQFKVFGILPISIIFAIINMPFILKNKKN